MKKNWIKRAAALGLSFLMAFSLAGCGSKSSAETAATEASSASGASSESSARAEGSSAAADTGKSSADTSAAASSTQTEESTAPSGTEQAAGDAAEASSAASGEASSAEASTENAADTASTKAAETSDTSQTSSETSSETASTEKTQEKDPYDLGITYTDDCVSTLVGDGAVMQIVVLGDSQFGNYKGKDGIAYQVSKLCNANVYNLAIGGTPAAIRQNESRSLDKWDSTCGIGMAYAVTGKVSSDFFVNDSRYEYQAKVFQGCDFSKTNVFVVEYGVNDFLGKIPIDNESDDAGAYRTALRTICFTLRNKYPNAAIVICGPGYAQFFQNGTYIGDSNTLNYGYGTLYDYSEAAQNVTESISISGVSFMNPYEHLHINASNAKENLLSDGIHMSPENRTKYAQMLSRIIIRSQGYTIDEGVDPSTVDWQSTKTDSAQS